VVNTNGVYGTQGTPAPANAPGSRQHGVLWVDPAGNVWLFGGFGLDSAGTGGPAGAILNDLWEFNTTTNQWTWVSGSNLANQSGTYGAQATTNLFTAVAGDVQVRGGALSAGAMRTATFGSLAAGTRYEHHRPDRIHE